MSQPEPGSDPHAGFEPDAQRLRRLRELLQRTRTTITYEQVAQALALLPPCTIRQVIAALEALMIEDAAAGRPLLSARVISRTRSGLPAPGFFELAAELGCYSGALQGEQARYFHQCQLARLDNSTAPDQLKLTISPLPDTQ